MIQYLGIMGLNLSPEDVHSILVWKNPTPFAAVEHPYSKSLKSENAPKSQTF
jgi:hypothetical protein